MISALVSPVDIVVVDCTSPLTKRFESNYVFRIKYLIVELLYYYIMMDLILYFHNRSFYVE